MAKVFVSSKYLLANMSGQERRPKIPAPPTPAGGSGNLLSSVAPPSQLPNFITTPIEVPQALSPQLPLTPQVVPQMPHLVSQTPQVVPLTPQVVPLNPQVLPPNIPVMPQPVRPVIVKPKDLEGERFSPAIPFAKGEPTMSIRSPEDSQTTQSPESLPESEIADIEKLGDVMPGSGLFTWMKGAVSTGGLLQRVAEKAKSSVDSMITTLDPQMKEYLKSGGDLLIIVASDKEVKVSPMREAFQSIFGKATVIGYEAQSNVTAAQPVGYAAAYAAAKQRIAHIRSVHAELTNNVPIVALESFLHEAVSDRWYDVALLVFSQPSLGIELQLQSQGTPVPNAAVTAAREATPKEYEHLQTGYSVTVGSIMGASLQVEHSQWQEAATGVSRRELLVLAGKSLAGSYKRLLAVSAATPP